ncbi:MULTISPECIES: TetR/AcrR family transcriptional regulator [Clostridium]|uniref:AcrR family transcriptional regulator n=1 Tax=Clostridium diolis TaxID=223919 RepID=A0AAV3W1D5_9CLOT|nr:MULTISPECIES: TetR/AcrR family transcriptional regulator [Clostridium]NRT76107.1 AcrR family transcriptional regulator [Clostridium beijerinckii]OOM41893.1 bacterial regulatory protein, tetR family [Clostridium beijerinckii]QES73343.1 TetR/AcrR family transcriptional regulator [Clostridium diolis]GEA32158.1 AcrR family transcriptional regulator [Clostridium diolis]
MNEKVSRRRGVILENAILDQAWLLLNQIGYSKLTMDDVAQAAKTNKNAIYRRWPQKCHLILAAVERKAPPIVVEISDHGSLKEDLRALFKVLDPIFEIIRPEDLREVISDKLSDTTSYDLFSVVNHENHIRKLMEVIITRANQRKEISLSIDTISEKALNLPTLLIINEIVLYGRPNETSSEDIINNILLPIYKASK